jgi:multiple antibiotic resistance protein
MDISFIWSSALLLFMLLDPFGNLPVFITLLKRNTPQEYTRIIFRECLFALGIMFVFLAIGRQFLNMMHLSPSFLGVGGGLILLLMGIKMVFTTFSEDKVPVDPAPFIVPIAVPYICDPGLISIVITLRGGSPAGTALNCSAAVLLAWILQTAILLCGRRIGKLLGNRVLDALESLLGLFLICMSVGMIIDNINTLYGIVPKNP